MNWNHTKWLVLSSMFFMVPSVYAFSNKLYSLGFLLNCTSLISANYWRKATYSWRRNLDLVFSKIAFVVFVSNGVFYIRTINYIVPSYAGLVALSYCYYLSGKLYPNNDWYKYHFAFHLILTFEQFIVIRSIFIAN